MPPTQPADAAAEREARDAGLADDAEGRREAERLRSGVELAEGRAGADSSAALLGIDLDVIQPGDVDHEPAVGDRGPGDVVPAAAHGHAETVLACERERLDDVADLGDPGDERRPPVDQPVPDLPSLVVARIARPHELTAEPCPEPGPEHPRRMQPPCRSTFTPAFIACLLVYRSSGRYS